MKPFEEAHHLLRDLEVFHSELQNIDTSEVERIDTLIEKTRHALQRKLQSLTKKFPEEAVAVECERIRTYKSFAEWLNAHTTEQDTNLAKLGRKVDVTRGYLCMLRSQERLQPSLNLIKALAKELGRPLAEALMAAGFRLT